MTRRLEDRRILVTGAANGLGLACATRFIAEGARVLLADIDTANGAAAAAALGENAAFIACDVASRADIDAAINTCVARWGGIDVLVNNAGIAPRGDILTTDEALFDRVLAINLKAAFHGIQLAAPHMIAAARGVIINMSSVNAVLTIPTLLAYNVAKGGLNQLTRNTAVMPLSVAKAARPMTMKTTKDFKLPAPTRTSVLLPQPDASTMPKPNSKPPTNADNQRKRLET